MCISCAFNTQLNLTDSDETPSAFMLQLPTSYFLLCLGKHLKYSSCLWPSKESTLDEAEEAMLGAHVHPLSRHTAAAPKPSDNIENECGARHACSVGIARSEWADTVPAHTRAIVCVLEVKAVSV